MFEIDNAEIIQATKKAILVRAPMFDEVEWIPLSQVHDDSEIWKKGETGTLIVEDWFAEQREWAE